MTTLKVCSVFAILCLSSVFAVAKILVLPDSKLTPGAVLTTDSKLICEAGYVQAIMAVAPEITAAVYKSYGITAQNTSDYKLDFLVPLELGGASVARNLWPQSTKTSPLNAALKDRLDAKLHELACTGKVSFADAQQAVAQNWAAAYVKYLGPLPKAGNNNATTSNSNVGTAPFANGECPPNANIKGSGNKKYHLPSGRYYKTLKAKVCFASETEAQNAGFVAAKDK